MFALYASGLSQGVLTERGEAWAHADVCQKGDHHGRGDK
jgi:hypothetical protein